MFKINAEAPKIDHLSRIRELVRTGQTADLPHWGDGKFVVGDGSGRWHYEGFVSLLKAMHEAMRAVDPSIPAGLPPHCLDPDFIAKFFSIPLEKMNVLHFRRQEMTVEQVPAAAGPQDYGATVDENGLPREVSTAEAARILGVSKDTVLKLKSAGLLEYRHTGSPNSCRPVFAFSLRSILELRTNYERDAPFPCRLNEPTRRAVSRKRKYKHLDLDD
jgi:hypothetical protein